MNSLDSLTVLNQLQQFKSANPVRAEGVGSRDLDFSTYVRKYCRPSKAGLLLNGLELGAFTANDLDWVINDYRNNTLRLLEIKTRGATFGFPQSKLWALLDNVLRVGSMHMTEHGLPPIRYGGLAVLRLQNTTPANSTWVRWMDRELSRSYTNWREAEISREEAWRRLNMLDMLEGAA
jgi:hypothetical protein